MSRPISRFLNWFGRLFTGNSGAKKSKIRLLAVGMSNSRKFGACPGAGIDAQRIYDRVSAGKKVLLLDSQATTSSVLAALKGGIAQTADDGLFVFYYSGHGGQVKSGDPSETDRKDETLCLWNGELVDNKIWSVLQTAKCRVFMVTDCCNSGTNFRAVMPFRSFIGARSIGSPRGLRLLHWGGCDDGKYSYGDDAGGIMTNAILSVIGDGLSYRKAFKKVSSASYKFQVPMRSNLGFDEDVEFMR